MSKFIDLTGMRFGRLTVVAPHNAMGKYKWECVCDCGGSTVTSTHHLTSGHTKSCGCLRIDRARQATSKDLSGMTFGRLKVLRRVSAVGGLSRYECECACGSVVLIYGRNLSTGATRSCGCYRSEVTAKNSTTHGGTQTRLYSTWRNMKARCLNPSNDEYDRYGGRGISICSDWEHSFESFREWAMTSGYKDDLTIDRIDNDSGYCPDNCQWLTRSDNIAKANRDRRARRPRDGRPFAC